jgi:hypothetical protein
MGEVLNFENYCKGEGLKGLEKISVSLYRELKIDEVMRQICVAQQYVNRHQDVVDHVDLILRIKISPEDLDDSESPDYIDPPEDLN